MIQEKLGVFGGTFSPPHIGHVRASEAFVREIRPDRLLVIPTFLPPHKEVAEGVSADDRLHMARLAFRDVPRAEVSDMEIRRGGKSYTSDTLRELTKKGRKIYLLCGTDMFLTLDTWHEPDVIFSLATVCPVRRENDPALTAEIERKTAQYRAHFGADIHPVPTDVCEISSEAIRAHHAAEDTVPAPVRAYIKERGLYR